MILSPLPKLAFLDNNGRPLVGGLLFTYEAGTSNKVDTYQDADGNVLNTNPIELDFRGECNLWADPLQSYKYILSPRGDTDPPTKPIWSVDDISALGGLTQQIIGQILYPITPSETAAGVTIINWYLPPGYVGRYGPLNDHTLQLALDANAGLSVTLPDADPIVFAADAVDITIPANTNIRVQDGGNAVIDARAATLTGAGLISSAGTIGSTLGGGLASAVRPGDFSVTLNSAPSLSPGDLTILRNTADGSWNPGNGSARAGEFLVVKSASGAVVTFASSVIGSYSGVTCGLYLVTPTTTCIEGNITILGNSADTANLPTIFIRNGLNNRISGVTLKDTTATCIELNTCYRPIVNANDTGKYETDAGSIQASGIVLSGCQEGHVYDNIAFGDRHGCSTGGGGTVVDRFNVFEHNDIGSRTNNAADFHASAEYCEYRNNAIFGAINLSGARNKLIDNVVWPNETITSLINMETVLTMDFTIEGNRFHMVGSVIRYVLDANASTDINSDTTEDGTLVIRANRILDETLSAQSYCFIRNNGSTAELRIECTDNIIEKTEATLFGAMLSVSVVSGSNFASILFQNNTMSGTYWGSFAADEIVVRNNSWRRSGSETDTSLISGSASNIYIQDNDLKGGGAVNVSIIGGGAKNKLISFKGNTYANNDLTTGIPVGLANAERVESANNLIGDGANTQQVNPISFNTIDYLEISNDTYIGNGAPDFSSISGFGPCTFTASFRMSLASSVNVFSVWAPPAGVTVMPTLAQGRCDTDITATNGNFWSLGVDGAARRTDYGVCTTAAAGSKHSKNAKFQRLTNPVNSAPLAGGTDTMSLMSVDAATDAANLASAMGGNAAQIITLCARFDLIGNLPNVP